MAGLGGLLLDDAGRAPEAVLARLARGLRRCGRGAVRQARSGAANLMHAPLLAGGDEESAGPGGGRPPLTSGARTHSRCRDAGPGLARRGPLLAAWDGRLDNGDELARACGWRPADAPGAGGDLERVLAAWESFGLATLERLVGDFALAVWDASTRRLVLARDGLATRPLFYARGAEGLVWGSSLHAVRRAAGVSRETDERWLAGFLTFGCDVDGTPFRDVRALAPGHALVVEPGAERHLCFWSPEPGEPLRLRDDREHEQRLRELLLEAVRCRLRGAGVVAAELSGGVDSSSIVVLADRLLRDGRAEARDLVTISHVYERAPGDDESEFMSVVEAHTGRPAVRVREADAPLAEGFSELEFEAPSLFQIWRARQRRVRAILAQHGAARLLSGFGGDQVMRSELDVAVEPAEHLRALRPQAFVASLRSWRAASRAAYPPQTWPALLWRGSLLPLLPYAWRRRFQTPRPPAWLDAGFVARTDLRARLAALVDTPRPLAPGRRRQVCSLASGIAALAWLHDTGAEPFEQAYPLLDRRVVDFCLRVPIEQFVRPHEGRSLQRRALRADLPERIATRHDKRGPDATLLRAVSEGWGEFAPLLVDSRLAARGLVQERLFVETARQARFGRAGDNLVALLKALALEAWLRAQEQPDTAGDDAPGATPRPATVPA